MKATPTFKSFRPSLFGNCPHGVRCWLRQQADRLAQTMADRAERIHHGYIYYLDGAGGGTAKKN